MSRPYDAVLFDLDGTLIGLDVREFIPAYFAEIGAFFARRNGDAEHLLDRLTRATEAMIRSDAPDRLNMQVFEAHFFDGVAAECVRREKLIFDRFYEEAFPGLGHLCHRIDGAREVVRQVQQRGIRRVLATNPLFPMVAIQTRLGWGGLSPDAFEHITSYENSYFCKPRPEYYRDLVEAAGLEPQRVLMVGNDPLEDMVAAEIGIDTYLVDRYRVPREGRLPQPTYSGDIAGVLDVVDNP